MKRFFFVTGLIALFLFVGVVPPSASFASGVLQQNPASSNVAILQPLSITILHSVQSILQNVKPASRTPRTRAIAELDEPSLEASLASVEWAVKRKDLRACEAIPEHADRADLLTVCVASIQRDAHRCHQIEVSRSPILHQLCLDLVAA